MPRLRDRFLTSASFGAAALIAAIPAEAQEAAAVLTADTPAAAQQDAADDIIVTANKREESINDVGITVAAIGSEQLQDRRIATLADFASTIPSLSYTNSANGTPVFTLRGVGFYETSLGAYPTVSTYIDEAPLPFPTLAALTAFDLERVEVLKGPQGTLFGQNATGGAVNFIAAKPTSTFAAGGSLSYGRFNTFEGEGFVSGPLAEGIGARLAVKGANGDGWQRSYTRDDESGRIRNLAGRLQVAVDASPGIRFLVNIDGWINKNDPVAPQLIGVQPQLPALGNNVRNYPRSPETPRAADWSPNSAPRADNRLWQTTLRADIDLNDAITLTSLTSYIDYKHRQTLDGDGMALNNLDILANNGRIKSFSQEVRLSQSTGPFRWVLGGNYGHDKVYELNDIDYTDSSASAAFGFGRSTYDSNQEMQNYAAFANAEFELLPKLTAKGGVRYTKAKRSASICNFDTTPGLTAGNFFYGLSTPLSGVSPGPYVSGACFALDNGNGFRPGRFNGELNEDNISYRAGIDFKPNRDLLFYANVSRAFKAGSFPSLSASTFSQYQPVTQERVQAYEGGVKATLLGGTLQANGAIYYYQYQDKQLRSKTIDPVFGILDNLANIPRSTVKGAELELIARPTRGLSVGINYAYTDAIVKEYVGVNAGGQASNFAGARIPYAPKHQVNVNGDYEFPITNDVEVQIGGTLAFRSNTVAIIGGSSLYEIDDYVTVDLRLGVKDAGGRWRAQIWGKNVGNEYYWDNVVAGYDSVARYAGRAATYGITVGFSY